MEKKKEILKKGYNYKKNYTDNENTDEYVMIVEWEVVYSEKKMKVDLIFLEKSKRRKRNLNPYN